MCRETIEILMRRAGLGPLWTTEIPQHPNMATASNLVVRQFERSQPADRLWITDITEHPRREAQVYCAVVLDTFSRRVVGWSIDSRPTASLVTCALGMAIDGRNPVSRETVI